MTPDLILEIGRKAMETTLLISAPMLLFSLAVGLLISIFQAVTQINEMTLTFVPKIIAVFLAILLFLPWMLQTIVGFTVALFSNIPHYVH
jgi:flagellar biosynthetic protein FliQ